MYFSDVSFLALLETSMKEINSVSKHFEQNKVKLEINNPNENYSNQIVLIPS